MMDRENERTPFMILLAYLTFIAHPDEGARGRRDGYAPVAQGGCEDEEKVESHVKAADDGHGLEAVSEHVARPQHAVAGDEQILEEEARRIYPDEGYAEGLELGRDIKDTDQVGAEEDREDSDR